MDTSAGTYSWLEGPAKDEEEEEEIEVPPPAPPKLTKDISIEEVWCRPFDVVLCCLRPLEAAYFLQLVMSCLLPVFFFFFFHSWYNLSELFSSFCFTIYFVVFFLFIFHFFKRCRL